MKNTNEINPYNYEIKSKTITKSTVAAATGFVKSKASSKGTVNRFDLLRPEAFAFDFL